MGRVVLHMYIPDYVDCCALRHVYVVQWLSFNRRCGSELWGVMTIVHIHCAMLLSAHER